MDLHNRFTMLKKVYFCPGKMSLPGIFESLLAAPWEDSHFMPKWIGDIICWQNRMMTFSLGPEKLSSN
ncbi:Hypothetical predicted protein [Podarcis lilfordi]|uniref:Uncharacterized protein n=1 Tax=Podarcis lilfordi TaxID=74358 RepID=A0AA35KMJ9_9SAUR|nr:Hypothetical predicted protein [Podarcis lilfordi]